MTDASLLEQLRKPAEHAIDTWRDVAARTRGLGGAQAKPRTLARAGGRGRVRLAAAASEVSGVADYSYRLLEPLSEPLRRRRLRRPDARAVQEAPSGCTWRPIGHFTRSGAAPRGYDQVFICLGNSEHHSAALDLSCAAEAGRRSRTTSG